MSNAQIHFLGRKWMLSKARPLTVLPMILAVLLLFVMKPVSAEQLQLLSSQQVKPLHQCQNMVYKNLPFHASVFCPSAKSYAVKVKNEIVTQLLEVPLSQLNVKSSFTFFQQPPSVMTGQGLVAQTERPCEMASGPHYLPAGPGKPVCDFLAYVGSVERPSQIKVEKYSNFITPVRYFSALMDDQHIPWFADPKKNLMFFPTLISNLGFNAKPYFSFSLAGSPWYNAQIPGDYRYFYSPNPNYRYTIAEQYHAHKGNASAYWGLTGGGGSGAGFSVKLLPKGELDLAKAHTVFSGGSGGGGGVVSPSYDLSLFPNLSSAQQIRVGAGGGGGVQFKSGLGLGAGVGEQDKTIVYSCNKRSGLTGVCNDVIPQYRKNLSALRAYLKKQISQGATVIIQGGGGMGVGLAYLQEPTKAGQGEWGPHAISSGGGFKFRYILYGKGQSARTYTVNELPISSTSVANRVNLFYQNMGRYINYATNLILHHSDDSGSKKTAENICKAQHALTLCMAIHLLPKKVPAWLQISHCDFSAPLKKQVLGQSTKMVLDTKALSAYQKSLVTTTQVLVSVASRTSEQQLLKLCSQNIKQYFESVNNNAAKSVSSF